MSQGIEAGKAVVRLGLDPASLDAGIKSAQAKLRGFASTARGLGTAFAGVGTAIVGPLALAVQEASGLQETMNKFNVVFGESAGAVKKWGDEYAASVGRSKKQVAEFLSETQDLLKPMGFAADAATAMSKDVTKLAVDLASFNNMADADVLRDLKAALTGSGEVMKKYGVIVSEAAVKQELLNMGLDPKNVTEMEKAQARFNIILRGTTDAQGDAERSAGAFANQMKKLWGQVSDTAAVVGAALIPALETALKAVNSWIPVMIQWIESNSSLIPIIAAVGLGVTALGGGLLTLSVLASGAAAALGLVATVGSYVISPFLLGAAAALALGAVFLWATGAFGELSTGFTDGMSAMGRAMQAGGIGAAFEAMWISMGATALDVMAKILEAFADLVDSITNNKVMKILEVLNPVLFARNKIADLASGGLRSKAADLRGTAAAVRTGRDAGINLLEQRQAADVAARAEAAARKKAAEKQVPQPAAAALPDVNLPEDIADAIAGITKNVAMPPMATDFARGVFGSAADGRRQPAAVAEAEPVRGGFDIRAAMRDQLQSQSPAARAEAEAALRQPWMQDYLQEPPPESLPADIADAIASISGGGAGPIDMQDSLAVIAEQMEGIQKQTRQNGETRDTLDVLVDIRDIETRILQSLEQGGLQ